MRIIQVLQFYIIFIASRYILYAKEDVLPTQTSPTHCVRPNAFTGSLEIAAYYNIREKFDNCCKWEFMVKIKDCSGIHFNYENEKLKVSCKFIFRLSFIKNYKSCTNFHKFCHR